MRTYMSHQDNNRRHLSWYRSLAPEHGIFMWIRIRSGKKSLLFIFSKLHNKNRNKIIFYKGIGMQFILSKSVFSVLVIIKKKLLKFMKLYFQGKYSSKIFLVLKCLYFFLLSYWYTDLTLYIKELSFVSH